MSNFFKSAKKVMPKKAFKKAIRRGKKKAKDIKKTILGQVLIDGLSDAIMSERAFTTEEDGVEDFFIPKKV